MAILLATFDIGASGIQGISLPWVVLATLIGCIAIGAFITIIGDIGVEHGISFPVYMRAPFGTVGTHIPSLTRAVTASFWFGINTYFGATAINAILHTMFAGFDNWLLCYLVFALVQLINTASGIKWVERFADVAAPIIIVMSLIIYQTLNADIQAQGADVWAWVASPVTGELHSRHLWWCFSLIWDSGQHWAAISRPSPAISKLLSMKEIGLNGIKQP